MNLKILLLFQCVKLYYKAFAPILPARNLTQYGLVLKVYQCAYLILLSWGFLKIPIIRVTEH